MFLVLPCLLPPTPQPTMYVYCQHHHRNQCSWPVPWVLFQPALHCTGSLVPHLTPLCPCHVHISHLTSGRRRIHLFLQARSNSHRVSSLLLCTAALQSTSSEATIPQMGKAKMSLLSAAESEKDHHKILSEPQLRPVAQFLRSLAGVELV